MAPLNDHRDYSPTHTHTHFLLSHPCSTECTGSVTDSCTGGNSQWYYVKECNFEIFLSGEWKTLVVKLCACVWGGGGMKFISGDLNVVCKTNPDPWELLWNVFTTSKCFDREDDSFIYIRSVTNGYIY